MALTKDFKDTVQARARRDPVFRKALLQEGVECLLEGDIGTGKAVLRDYINATIGFEALSSAFDKSSKSLMRMFGPKGNPQAGNLFAVIRYLQEREGVRLEVKARRVADRGDVSSRSSSNHVGGSGIPGQRGVQLSKVDVIGVPRRKIARLPEGVKT
ncbi:helix-turn-helix domain-containing transcriptional regulator [Thioalkalivibrio sp. HK1]|uniref:helix-turn-helix domain-containing transcriptional regulator n=1 Tax=Thioalkalivibrio sp. HK1 TaxID=1469245 RepID=UPI00047202D5|nr:hypothetical protein [Thioalkalivibrio sp. HK1]